MDMLNGIFAAMLAAIQSGVTTLATFGLPVLSAAALISFYYQGGLELAYSSGGSIADALGGLVYKLLVIGLFDFVVVFWQPLTQAILETMLFLSLNDQAHGLLLEPGVVWQIGQQVTSNLGRYNEFWQGQAATWNFVISPRDFILFMLALGSFLIMALHFGMLLLEFYLAVMVGIVFLPWGLIRPLGHLGEFVVGWLSGACIRALVSAVLIGLSFALFTTLPPSASGPTATFVDPMSGVAFPVNGPPMTETFGIVAGALLFALCCLLIPARAARMVSGASLALTGSDITAAAMTTARFGMALNMGILRGTSRMLARI
jgi:type IV secretory pathway TrbL component